MDKNNVKWRKHSQEEIKNKVFEALSKDVDYEEENILGVPASYLDDKVFYRDASFIKEAPYISTLLQNPNHIGCHTLGKSESFFKGTQVIEKELIDICAEDILKAKPEQCDGYVASGGTEANFQAMWIYRNYFRREFGATPSEVGLLCSTDSHYCVDKGANIFGLNLFKIPVDENTRLSSYAQISQTIKEAKKEGIKYFIVLCNMMTTMFGSVDQVDDFAKALKESGCQFKLHIDGAFGGFYYPFTGENPEMSFANKDICSVTLDAHKMAQAPYGTGIFLIRKNYMKYAYTQEASYVEGQDSTLIGSRSGANAIAVWMILVKNGPFGWAEKIFILQKRTAWMCDQLSERKIEYYRHPQSNIITIRSNYISAEIADQFGLVPDKHDTPKWYKIVVMEHVTIEKLQLLLDAIG